VKSDWDAWSARSLAEEPIVRLIVDGTAARVRLDCKATSISLLVVIGVRADGQKVLLAIKSMGGESAEAWRNVRDDLVRRGVPRPQFLIVDGALGLDKAIVAVPVQRRTVHKHRNLLAPRPRAPGHTLQPARCRPWTPQRFKLTSQRRGPRLRLDFLP
jgi:transposase-like protein